MISYGWPDGAPMRQDGKTGKRQRRRNRLLLIFPFCAYCGCDLDELTATLDHIHPLAKGGQTTDLNTTLACRDCNKRKRDDIWPVKYMYRATILE